MDCRQRKDEILLYVAGALEEDSSAELRQHLASGCPECAGAIAEAEALMAQLPLALEPIPATPAVRDRLLKKINDSAPASIPLRPISVAPKKSAWDWDRIILPSAVAAVLAVSVTLITLRVTNSLRPPSGPDQRDFEIAMLQKTLEESAQKVNSLQVQLKAASQQTLSGMKYAALTGPVQPDAKGSAFIDLQGGKWYFFTNGMKPPVPGMTYELWLIAENHKMPAGTFMVNQTGTATLTGAIPPLPAGTSEVTLAVTDEPMGGTSSPTGTAQIVGKLQLQ